jgi:hypothetical protein
VPYVPENVVCIICASLMENYISFNLQCTVLLHFACVLFLTYFLFVCMVANLFVTHAAL